jgi:NAD+ kinase
MRIAIFGKNCKQEDLCYIEDLFEQISLYSKELFVSKEFYNYLQGKIKLPKDCSVIAFEEDKISDQKIELLFSLGGDGTLLDTLSVVKNTGLPVLGINLGHLGFLTSVGRKEIKNLLSEIEKGNYKVERHSVLKASYLSSNEERFAINEVCIRSLSPGELLEIDAYIGNEYLTTYTSDG